MKRKEMTFGVIVSTRGFFNPELARGGRKDILDVLDKKGYRHVILPVDATPTGVVEGYEDAKKCAALFKENRDVIDGIIVILPNFGDEIGIANAIKLSELNVPVLVQASNDHNDKVDVLHRRDAFCGKISVCNNLYQYNIPFTNTSLHTCDITSETFSRDIDRFAAVCRIVKGVSKMRIGAIGARPAAFQTVRFSEKLLQKFGITVVPVDLSEMISAANALDAEHPAVKAKIESISAYGTIENHIKNEEVVRQAKLSVAIDQFVAQNELDATAIQCWESIQNNYGCATCLSMSMMGENGLPSACEMDISGAVSMYILRLAAEKASGFLDWNNNFDYEREICVCTHCSNYPASFMGNPVKIGQLDILGNTFGKEKCFGAIKGKVAPGDMTYFRISTDDCKGTIKAYGGEGEFTNDPYGMDGGIAVCKIPGLNSLMEHVCREGFEHHVSMVRGHHGAIIEEALTRYLNWDYTGFCRIMGTK
ncbi:MAG: fucose isomerase [Spirochaetales bacterium]|nr:fucose isomerase [Spirochaetales bacterium]